MSGSGLWPNPLRAQPARWRAWVGGAARGLAALLVLPLVAAAAQEQPPSPRQMLADMASAYETRTFSGRFIYMRAGEVSTLALQRAVIDGKEYERLTHLQGRATTVIRNNGRTVTVQPDQSVTLVASGGGITPVQLGDDGSGIPEQYHPRLAGTDRVAGRPCWRLELEPRDRHRYGYRLWLDQESTLPLKSEVIDGDQGVLERVEFISLELAPRLDREHFSLPDHLGKASDTDQGPVGEPRITMDWLPPGFAMAAREAHRLEGRTGVLNSATYTDGVATFTVFVEPAPDAGASVTTRRRGPTVVLVRNLERGPGVYRTTLVGEIPPRTAERVLDGVLLEAGDD